jgi:hypothetical protein
LLAFSEFLINEHGCEKVRGFLHPRQAVQPQALTDLPIKNLKN